MYYSAGLLSKRDIYPDHKVCVLKGEEAKAPREKKERTKNVTKRKKKTKSQEKEGENKTVTIKNEPGTSGTSNEKANEEMHGVVASIKKEPVDFGDAGDFSLESDADETDGLGLFENMTEPGSALQSPSPLHSVSPSPHSPCPHPSPKGKKKRGEKGEKGERKGKSKKEKGPPSVKSLIAQRRKLWLTIAKKEISKVFFFFLFFYIIDLIFAIVDAKSVSSSQASKARVNNHKEELVSCKRAATGCMRVCRLRAMQSQKAMKEIVWRAKRLTREMQSYWKRYDRVEKV